MGWNDRRHWNGRYWFDDDNHFRKAHPDAYLWTLVAIVLVGLLVFTGVYFYGQRVMNGDSAGVTQSRPATSP